MKRLTILRHAKSSWDHPERDDLDRPLSERGRKAARRMGRELKQRKMRFDLVLASPAARVRETLDGLGETYGDFNCPVRFEPRIYMADGTGLLGLVRALGDDVECPLLVGHNPGLERLIAILTQDDQSALSRRVAGKFPTAALAVIEIAADSWAEVETGRGRIADLILPRELGERD